MGLSAAYVKEGKRTQAIDEAVALAKYPNVSIKLSAAPSYTEEPYPFRDMTPFIRKCFEAFGAQRCYWGTDMTNSLAKATYNQRIRHFEEFDFMSEADKDLVMRSRPPRPPRLGCLMRVVVGWAKAPSRRAHAAEHIERMSRAACPDSVGEPLQRRGTLRFAHPTGWPA